MSQPELKIDANGTKCWYLNGKYHREDGPAVEDSNGTKGWFLNGKLHREDGPTIEYPDGSKFWYLNGEYHCEDGPAVEYPDGSKFWYLNGKSVSWQDVFRLAKTQEQQVRILISALTPS
jgi:(2Fe-2S) ferredoxin